MGTADTAAKRYMMNNRIFADVCNYFLGRNVVDPNNLRTIDTDELSAPHTAGRRSRSIEKYRDLMKLMTVMEDGKAVYVLFGIENQTQVHYAMPVRVMLYDAMRYTDQVSETAAKHRRDKKKEKSAEFLSGFHKEDTLMPVITFVVYYGSTPWDGARSLHEMYKDTDSRILPHVRDYGIDIIEPSAMTSEEFDRFETSLREIMMYIKYSSDKEKLTEIVETEAAFRELDREAVEVINAVTGGEIEYNEEEETVDMCKALRDIKADSRAEGKAEGKAELIQNLMDSLQITFDKAADILKIVESEREMYKKMIEQ